MAKVWRYGTLTVAVILLMILSCTQGLPKFVQSEQLMSVSKPPTSGIPASLFNLHVINLKYGATWPNIPFHGWRSFYSDWSGLEPKKDEWHFEYLDWEVSQAQQHGVEMTLILYNTPTWASARPKEKGCCTPDAPKGNTAEASNIEDWRNYVRKVATRYKGRVHYYEFWNEPNVERFYSGTAKQLGLLNRVAYQVLKEVDPTITVISSALSPYGDHFKYFEDYLAQGGGEYADIIGYHFYVPPKPPEAMLPLIQRVKVLMAKYGLADKSLWNTETGWRIINRDKNIKDEEWAGNPLSSEDASAYIARSYLLSWAMGVKRLYWYAWGHRSMGLTDYDARTPKPVATAYSEVKNWLVGAQMRSCQLDKQKTWICQLRRDRGYLAWIVWNPDKSLLFNLPRTWGVQQIRDLSGKKRKLLQVNQVKISPSPLLLERVR